MSLEHSDKASSSHLAEAEPARELLVKEAFPSKGACSAIVDDQSKFDTLEKLKTASKSELDCLYNNSPAGKIPEGDTKGIPLFMPGTALGGVVDTAVSQLWQGKVFGHGNLTNKIGNTDLFNAEVEQGQSWSDSKPSIVIDYNKGQRTLSDHLTTWIRDEIREIRPGIYLGQLHNQGLPFISKDTNITYFALDANKKK